MNSEQREKALHRATELRLAGRLNEAKTVLEQSLAEAEDRYRTGPDQALLVGELAQVYLRAGNWRSADELLHEALQLLGPNGKWESPSYWAMLNERKAYTLFRRGKFDEARDLAESLAAAVVSSDAVMMSVRADIYNTLGGIALTQHQMESGMQYTRQAALLYERAEDHAGAANAHANLGVVHYACGNWNEAMREFEASEAIRATRGIVAGRTIVLYNMGVVAFSRGEYEKARDHFVESLGLSQRSGEQYDLLRTQMALAHLDLLELRTEQACSRLDEVLASPELPDEHRIQAIWLKALVECDRGGVDAGIALAAQARQIAKDSNLLISEIECCLALASAHRRAKNYDHCEQHLNEAIELARRAGDTYRGALALLDISEIRHETKVGDVEKYAAEACSVFEKLGAKRHLDRARSLLGLA